MAESKSSLINQAPDNPYASRPSPLKQHIEHPTSLRADCRHFANQSPKEGIPICRRPQDLAKTTTRVGSGPSWAGVYNAHLNGGFVDPCDTSRLVVSVSWNGASDARGAVMAVNLESGDRTIISGQFQDEKGGVVCKGEGHAFAHLNDVQPGPDGKTYFAFSVPKEPTAHEIVRIDPESGARTLVWKSRDTRFGQLLATDGKTMVQTHPTAFAVDKDGSFLLGISNPQTGRGIVRVAADGSTCEPVSVDSPDKKLARGSGPEMRGFSQGLTLKDGKIYTMTTQPKQFLEIDPSTGDRSLIIKPNAAGGIGERWAVWDEKHNVWWTAGLMNSVTVVAVDPETKKTFHIMKALPDQFPWFPLGAIGPAQINSLNYGGIWKHPTKDNLLMAQDSISIVELEISSGNSIILSL